jgi:hypothetical protein
MGPASRQETGLPGGLPARPDKRERCAVIPRRSTASRRSMASEFAGNAAADPPDAAARPDAD